MSVKYEEDAKTELCFKTVPESDRQLIDTAVTQIVEQNRYSGENIELLAVDALNCVEKADALQSDYGKRNRNFFVRAFNDVTGKNNKAVLKMFDNLKTGQYAVVRLMQKLNEDNLLSLQKSTDISRRVSQLQGECDAEFEHIYEIIANIMSGYSARLKRLEDRTEKNRDDISDLKYDVKKLKRSVMMNCQSCNEEIKSGEFVCPKCGKTVTAALPDFTEEDNLRELEKYAAKLSDMLMRENELSAFAWDKTVQRYADTMIRVQSVINGGFIESGITAQLKENIGDFIKKCGNKEFQIALIGAVKAGKSTLMNAITGCEAASTRVTPETASLTKFRSSKSDENYISVKFYTNENWEKLWSSVNASEDTRKRARVFFEEYNKLNAESEKSKWVGHEPIKKTIGDFEEFKKEVEKWTSSRSAVHYFVEEVEIGLGSKISDFDMPAEVVFVDTPGLDDPVEYRSEITRKYLKTADAVVVCIKADAIKGSDLHTISDVFKYSGSTPQKVFLCATQCDRLNDPFEEWKELKEKWIDHLKQDQYYGETALAEKNIIAASAYFYNLMKKYPSVENMPDSNADKYQLIPTIMKYRSTPVDYSNAEKRENLMNVTNIGLIKRRLQTDIIDKRREYLEREIANSYGICSDSLKDALDRVIADRRQDISRLEKSIDDLLAEKEENEKRIEQFRIEKEETVQEMRALMSETKMNMKELLSEINKFKISDYE